MIRYSLRPCSRKGCFPLLRQIRVLVAVTCLYICAFSVAAEPVQAADLSTKLDSLKTTIADELTTALQKTNFDSSYTTVWRQYEDAVIDALIVILPNHVPELSRTNFDIGKTGREKNRLADFGITCGTNQIEISIKSARNSANPENDMGTFNDHPVRVRTFTSSFTVWVRYDDSMPEIKCDRAFFDKTWKFVGKSSLVDGVKYRKKDGNMRPKPWRMFDSGKTYWVSQEDFEAAVRRSEMFRANELIKEHLQDMSEQDQRMLYEQLKLRFDEPSSTSN